MDERKQMGSYSFSGLGHVIWGEEFSRACVAEVSRLGGNRIAIISSPSLRKATASADRLSEVLGPKAVLLFDELEPHTPHTQVVAFADEVKAARADLIISLGGGTPIDTAKVVIAMIDAGATDPYDVAGVPPRATTPTLRQIACPTTLSGAEFSDLAGLTDRATKVKHGVSSFGIGPVSVVLDPQLALHTPLDLWLSTGIRAVDHAIETLCSVDATPYTDALAADALSSLASSLRRTKEDPADIDARQQAQLAVWMASAGLDRTPYGASHGIGHQLGAVAGTPHGICSCILLPAVLEWNIAETASAQRRIADLLVAESAAEGVRTLLKDLALPASLSEAGVARDMIPEIAAGSVQNRWVKTNPRPLNMASEIEDLLNTAY